MGSGICVPGAQVREHGTAYPFLLYQNFLFVSLEFQSGEPLVFPGLTFPVKFECLGSYLYFSQRAFTKSLLLCLGK